MKLLTLLTALDAEGDAKIFTSCRRLVLSAVKFNLDSDVIVIHNSKNSMFAHGLERFAEFNPLTPILTCELVETYGQRIRPSLLSKIDTKGYDKVMVLDVDSILLRPLNFDKLDNPYLYSSVTPHPSYEDGKHDSSHFPAFLFTPSFIFCPAGDFSTLMAGWRYQLDLQEEQGALRPDVLGWHETVVGRTETKKVSPDVFANGFSRR